MVSYFVNSLNLLKLWIIVHWYGHGTYRYSSLKVPNAKQPPTQVQRCTGRHQMKVLYKSYLQIRKDYGTKIIKAAPHAWGILEGKDNQRLQQNSSKHGCDVRLLGFPAHSRPLMCSPTAKPCRNGDEQISFNKGCLQATSQPLSRPPLLFPILPNSSKATS